MEHFITEIQIRQLLHLSNLKISLTPHSRQNLILTGKNGSGKTTLLLALEGFLDFMLRWEGKAENKCHFLVDYVIDSTIIEAIEKYEEDRKTRFYRYLPYIYALKGINIALNTTAEIKRLFSEGSFVIAYYPAERRFLFEPVNGVEDVRLRSCYGIEENPGTLLLKYMVHLKTQQAYANNAGDGNTVELIEKWFARFENALQVLVDQNVHLEYDYREYCFWIVESPQKRYAFSQLSDGYSAIVQIVTDLMLRMDQNWLKSGVLSCYNVEGIVLIDELETHLHIDLQRKILPFLTTFFSRIQFIVSTHSPYILNSISNALVYDMEKNVAVEDMSAYSAESIVEGYFDEQSYSEEIRRKILRYEELVFLQEPSEEERAERAELRIQLKGLSGQLSGEAKAAFEEIEDRRKRNG